MKRFAAFLALAFAASLTAGWSNVARAADDALSQEANQAYLAASAKKPRTVVKPSGLQFRILQNGFGKRPTPTDSVTVYYTGALINGKVFDGTSPGLPATFKVNAVIPGWTEALMLMREGDHWEVVIPASIGYGVRGRDTISPPNQTLVFDLRLVAAIPAPKRGEKGYVPDPDDKDEQP